MAVFIHPNLKSQYEFLMLDFDTIIRFTKDPDVLKNHMDKYWNNYIKTHSKVEDLAAFAMALNHTGLKCTWGENVMTIFANLCAKTTAYAYENMPEDSAAVFHAYID